VRLGGIGQRALVRENALNVGVDSLDHGHEQYMPFGIP